MRNGLNVFLLVLLILQAALFAGLRRDTARRFPMATNDMIGGPSYHSFEPNEHFEDGRTLQLPPEGVIARGAQSLQYAATPEDNRRAGRELRNPFAADDMAALARGGDVYRNACASCHGPTGGGDGTVVQRGFPPPPSLRADGPRGRPDGELFHVITYGQGNMPPHAAQIEMDDRWKAILYIRSLQRQP